MRRPGRLEEDPRKRKRKRRRRRRRKRKKGITCGVLLRGEEGSGETALLWRTWRTVKRRTRCM